MRKTILPNTILLLLFLSYFMSCEPKGNTSSSQGEATTNTNASLSVVFIQSDSLQTGYTALATELGRLEENFNKAQENLGRDANALQREVNSLQTKAQQGLLSPNQIQAEQQRLAKKEQELMQRRDVAMGSIQEEQMQLQAAFTTKVQAVLEEIKAEKGYDFILNKSAGSGVLVANDALDITPMVLARLNALPSSQDTSKTE